MGATPLFERLIRFTNFLHWAVLRAVAPCKSPMMMMGPHIARCCCWVLVLRSRFFRGTDAAQVGENRGSSTCSQAKIGIPTRLHCRSAAVAGPTGLRAIRSNTAGSTGGGGPATGLRSIRGLVIRRNTIFRDRPARRARRGGPDAGGCEDDFFCNRPHFLMLIKIMCVLN